MTRVNWCYCLLIDIDLVMSEENSSCSTRSYVRLDTKQISFTICTTIVHTSDHGIVTITLRRWTKRRRWSLISNSTPPRHARGDQFLPRGPEGVFDRFETSKVGRESSTKELMAVLFFALLIASRFSFSDKNDFLFASCREKTRSLLVNVFRTRRSNAALGSNEVCEKFFVVFFFFFFCDFFLSSPVPFDSDTVFIDRQTWSVNNLVSRWLT